MTLDLASADQLRSALATVAAIPVTPFGPDGQVDWDAHGRVIRRMVDAGVGLITPNGNTGEFYALTAAEARRVTESAVAAAGDSHAGILAGVGHDLPGAIEAARHARDNGVRMIMVHQPVGPYVSAEGWLDYHRRHRRRTCPTWAWCSTSGIERITGRGTSGCSATCAPT